MRKVLILASFFMLVLNGTSFAKFTIFERMNDIFYGDEYLEFEYNYYYLESKSGFTDYESEVNFVQLDQENTSKRSLHELSFNAADFWGLSFLANIMSNQLEKMNDWDKGYSISRYNFSLMYDAFKIEGENKFYLIGLAYDYTNFHFSNPSAQYYTLYLSTETGYTAKQSMDFITHDALLYCIIAWPKWGDMSNAYITLRGGPSWLNTRQDSLSIIYDSDPEDIMGPFPSFTLENNRSSMKNRGFNLGLGAHYITHNILSIFMDLSLSFWNATANGDYYDHMLNIMRYKIQTGVGLHFGDKARLMASVVIDNFECGRELSNYDYNYADMTVRFVGYQIGLTIIF